MFLPMALAMMQTPNSAIVPVPRTDEWWKNRHAAIVKRVAEGPVDAVMIGDSITHGFGGAPHADSANMAGNKIWEKLYQGKQAITLGFSGDRTQHVLWRLENGEMKGIRPKLTMIMIGTNNMSSNTPAEIAEGVQAIVAWLKKNQRQSRIGLQAIFPRDPNPDNVNRRKVEATNELLKQIRGVDFLDFNQKFLDEYGVLRREIMPDALHPNAAGYRIWGDAIEKYVRRHLS